MSPPFPSARRRFARKTLGGLRLGKMCRPASASWDGLPRPVSFFGRARKSIVRDVREGKWSPSAISASIRPAGPPEPPAYMLSLGIAGLEIRCRAATTPSILPMLPFPAAAALPGRPVPVEPTGVAACSSIPAAVFPRAVREPLYYSRRKRAGSGLGETDYAPPRAALIGERLAAEPALPPRLVLPEHNHSCRHRLGNRIAGIPRLGRHGVSWPSG